MGCILLDPKLDSKVHSFVISLKRQWLGEHEFRQP
jgi:hypothetical protein